MRPELQKILSNCGIAEKSSSQTTLVCSNQQYSGPLYKGVRQSVSKKAEPPTETGPANKWLLVKTGKKASFNICNRSQITMYLLPCVLSSFIWSIVIKDIILKHHEQWKRDPSLAHVLSCLHCGVALVLQRSCHMSVSLLDCELHKSDTLSCPSYHF